MWAMWNWLLISPLVVGICAITPTTTLLLGRLACITRIQQSIHNSTMYLTKSSTMYDFGQTLDLAIRHMECLQRISLAKREVQTDTTMSGAHFRRMSDAIMNESSYREGVSALTIYG